YPARRGGSVGKAELDLDLLDCPGQEGCAWRGRRPCDSSFRGAKSVWASARFTRALVYEAERIFQREKSADSSFYFLLRVRYRSFLIGALSLRKSGASD
ncbi:hypothetical protein, partial [Ensifer sp. SSB1]|uniref:hypothetical protein n=1 Tax=Ensifer sp. SSB1 TaxID=2795385 RepID=UPI0025C2C522